MGWWNDPRFGEFGGKTGKTIQFILQHYILHLSTSCKEIQSDYVPTHRAICLSVSTNHYSFAEACCVSLTSKRPISLDCPIAYTHGWNL